MDYNILTVDELKQGYRFDGGTDSYACLTCGEQFVNGQVYPIGGPFLCRRACCQTAYRGRARRRRRAADQRRHEI